MAKVEHTLEIQPRDHSIRVDTVFPAPITMALQRLSNLIGDLVADFDQVDDDQPITVAPIAFDPDKALTRYQLRYWVHPYADRGDLQVEVLRRVWYALQREGVAWPVVNFYDSDLRTPQKSSALLGRDWPEAIAAALATAPAHPALVGLQADAAQAIAAEGVALYYAPPERIVLPPRVRGSVCLLVQGEAREIASQFDTLAMPGRHAVAGIPDRGAEGLSRRTMVKRIADRLAEDIGPYAEIAVRRAANEVAGASEIGAMVADEIADPKLRCAFLADVCAPGETRYGPGMVFGLRLDVAGNLVADPLLRTVGPAPSSRSRLECLRSLLDEGLLCPTRAHKMAEMVPVV